jgi:hypothetical protein
MALGAGTRFVIRHAFQSVRKQRRYWYRAYVTHSNRRQYFLLTRTPYRTPYPVLFDVIRYAFQSAPVPLANPYSVPGAVWRHSVRIPVGTGTPCQPVLRTEHRTGAIWLSVGTGTGNPGQPVLRTEHSAPYFVLY